MIIDDDGELDYSNQLLFSNNNENQLQSNCSIDEFFKDFIVDNNHACTHTHTCNPPGPDSSHTHTCFHVHTKILPPPFDDKGTTDDTTADSIDKKSKKRPTVGNREAVRKYREKKKARANCLEDEVKNLKDLNQQLMKRLQNQAVLEAEVTRLKCLLVDIRGRIEGEIGSFPYQKQPTKVVVDGMQNNMSFPNLGGGGGGYMMNPCDNVRCDDQVHCMHPGMENMEVGGFNGEEFGACNVGYDQCSMGNTSIAYKELPGCGGVANSVPALNYLAANKRKDHCQGMHFRARSFQDDGLNCFAELISINSVPPEFNSTS